MAEKKAGVDAIIASLSPIEREILPYLHLGSVSKICEATKKDSVKVTRALQFLSNKKLVKLQSKTKKQVLLGKNGIIYLKQELPERRLINLLAEKKIISLDEAKEKAKLSENELGVALGVLKKKAMIKLVNGKINLGASREEIIKKMLEEKFLEELPLDADKLSPEQRYALEQLSKRKDIVKVEEKKEVVFSITKRGKEIAALGKKLRVDLIEELTPQMIKTGSWKRKRFREYDIASKVPAVYGGKRHFVNQAIDYARKIWLEMGFQEMKGPIINTSFWNFDALFVPQDHPAREMQDTFFLEDKGRLPKKEIVKKIRRAHEKGTAGSKGWQYGWEEEEAKKLVLRTHTTVLSAQTLAKLKKSDWPAKFFAMGRNYRNETLDWKHLFEFNQTEGIVVDPNANFRHLIGYLKEFLRKMAFEKARFRPSYFPYTEPSIEMDVFHPVNKRWMELGGAGIFRPEVTEPLLGEPVPVLAWGPGFDRILTDYYKINDLRELYKNDIGQLRKVKPWIK